MAQNRKGRKYDRRVFLKEVATGGVIASTLGTSAPARQGSRSGSVAAAATSSVVVGREPLARGLQQASQRVPPQPGAKALRPETEYSVAFRFSKETHTASGAELMKSGIPFGSADPAK